MTFALHIKEHYSCKIFTHHFLQNLSTINSLYNYYYLYYLIRWISKSQYFNFKHCVFKVLILHAIIFSPRLISFPFKILSLFPLPCPLKTKSHEMFLYQMLLFRSRKSQWCSFSKHVQTKELNWFWITCRTSFKTKMKEIYCFQKLNIIKNQNDWFPKKKK